MRCRASWIRKARLGRTKAVRHVWDTFAPYKVRCTSVTVSILCSNRAATRVNLSKCWEKHWHSNMAICGHFAISRNVQQSIMLPSHGRDRWFETSIAHFGNTCKTRYSGARYSCQDCWCAATAWCEEPGLFRLVTKRIPARLGVMPAGKDLVSEWNDAHPQWPYKTSVGDPNTRQFWRDYNRIKRTIAVGPP